MFVRKAAMSAVIVCSLLFTLIAGAVPARAAYSGLLAGKTIILDAGHGVGSDNVFQGYSEHTAMLFLARAIRTRMEPFGARVLLTRDANPNISLPVRCAMINIWALEAVREEVTDSAQIAEINELIGLMRGIINDPTGAEGRRLMNTPFDATREIHDDLVRVFGYQNHPVIRDTFLAISLHSNATQNPINPNIRGGEVYFICSTNVSTSRYFQNFSYTNESRRFGNILLNHIQMEGIPRRAHGLRAENLFFLREMNVPAVLAENGFHTNPQDRALLMSNEFLGRLANAYVRAIFEHFRVPPPTHLEPWQPRVQIAEMAPPGSWRRDNTGWWFRFDEGGFARGWYQIDGLIYLFNYAGYMQTGWVHYNGYWHYLRSSGAMATGWVRTGGHWYYLHSSGAMATGWILIGGVWYYLRSSGVMATGWIRDDGEWYYLRSSGAMATGWVRTGGHWYYLRSSGTMATGWILTGGHWYYLHPSGAMATGTVTADGERHRFATDGRWLGGA